MLPAIRVQVSSSHWQGEFVLLQPVEIEVIFRADGEEFDPGVLTDVLGVSPTLQYRKGDFIPLQPGLVRPEPKFRQRSSWQFSTGRRVSWDMTSQLRQVVNVFASSLDLLGSLSESYSMEYVLEVVLYVSGGDPSELVIAKDVVDFVCAIGAEIDIDLYAV